MPAAASSDATIIEAVRSVLPDARTLWVFGSHAQGTAQPASDLDLAVLFDGRADVVALWEAAQDLACRLDVDVDLVDLLAASTVLQFQIVTGGRRLFARDPLEADLYEVFILSEMTRLREARAALVEDIQQRGRVHGR